jgi:hypothetical protein
LAPLHRYRIEDKRNRKEEGGGLSSSLGASVRSAKAASMASSLISGMNNLRLDQDIIEEGEEDAIASPAIEEPGIVLRSLQQKFAIIQPGVKPDALGVEDSEDVDLAGQGEDDELQFELS